MAFGHRPGCYRHAEHPVGRDSGPGWRAASSWPQWPYGRRAPDPFGPLSREVPVPRVRPKAVAGPFIGDGGQALLEQLRIVTGDLVVELGAGQGKDVNGGGRGMLPAWARGGQCLGLAGAVTAIARIRKQAASMNAAPRVGQARSMIQVRSGPRRMFSGLKSVCSRASTSSRSRPASRSTYAAQSCRACFTGRSGQLIAASWCMASMTRGRPSLDDRLTKELSTHGPEDQLACSPWPASGWLSWPALGPPKRDTEGKA